MKCPKCGYENIDSASACEQCGCELTKSAQAQPVNARTSGLAKASFICSLLAPLTCLVTGYAGFILGIFALVQIKISEKTVPLKGKVFAVWGIVLAVLFVGGVIAMDVLTPALIACRMTPGTQLRGIRQALTVYAYEHDDEFPVADQWCDLLMQEADVSKKQFIHPKLKHKKGSTCGFALNKNVVGMKYSEVPADMVVLFECEPGWNQVGGADIMNADYYDGQGLHVAFGDSHVEFVKEVDIPNLRWSVEEPAGVEE